MKREDDGCQFSRSFAKRHGWIVGTLVQKASFVFGLQMFRWLNPQELDLQGLNLKKTEMSMKSR